MMTAPSPMGKQQKRQENHAKKQWVRGGLAPPIIGKGRRAVCGVIQGTEGTKRGARARNRLMHEPRAWACVSHRRAVCTFQDFQSSCIMFFSSYVGCFERD